MEGLGTEESKFFLALGFSSLAVCVDFKPFEVLVITFLVSFSLPFDRVFSTGLVFSEVAVADFFFRMIFFLAALL